MLNKGLSILFFISFCFASGYSQSKEDNSFAPVSEESSALQKKLIKKKGKKSNRALFNKNMDNKIKEFDKRMMANARQDRKEARMALKPQYSDPLYFGHKRKPKKRPPGKRKFCKECHLTH